MFFNQEKLSVKKVSSNKLYNFIGVHMPVNSMRESEATKKLITFTIFWMLINYCAIFCMAKQILHQVSCLNMCIGVNHRLLNSKSKVFSEHPM